MILKKGIESIMQAVSNKHWVEQVVDSALEKQMKTHNLTGYFYPSMAGDCPRLIQLNMFGLLKPSVDYKLQRIFDNGNSVHQRYVEYFKTADKLIQEEVSFRFKYNNFTVSGRADIIIKDFQDKKHIGEMKSINDRRYEELRIVNNCVEEHFLQWVIYSHGLKIPDGFILYENKNDQRILIFPVQFNNEIFTRIMNKFSMIHDYNSKGLLVPKPSPCPDGKYCNAKSICSDSNPEKVFDSAVISEMFKKMEGKE